MKSSQDKLVQSRPFLSSTIHIWKVERDKLARIKITNAFSLTNFPRNFILSQCFIAGHETLPQGYSRFRENRISESERGRHREKERGSDCLAETVENCGYALQEPLKGRLPARTIDYRNASHTVSQSEQVKLC